MKKRLFARRALSLGFLSSVCVCAEACSSTPGGDDSSATAASAVTSSAGALVGLGGKCLDVEGLRTDPSAKVQIWDCWGGENQKWKFSGNAVVGIGGKCLEVANASTADGGTVHIATCNGSAGQAWTLANGQLLGVGGKCLDVAGANSANGTPVISWTCRGGANQKWQFTGSINGGGGSGVGDASGEQARRADELSDALGVNTHLGWGGSLYDARFDDLLVPAVTKLGVRHIREGAVSTSGWPTTHYLALVDRVKAATGTSITFDIVTDPPDCNSFAADPGKTVQFLPASAVESFESLNEYDNPSVGHRCPWSSSTWAGQQRTYQQNLWNAVRSNPAIAPKWVFGPSLTQAPRTATELGDLSAFMTHGNMHSYPGNGQPTNAASERAKLTAMNGSRPMVATETGYHTWPQTSSGFRGLSEHAEGKYAGRLLTSYFNAGVVRAYFYELIDDPIATWADIEQHFGLVRSDGSEKPAFTTLKNMMTLLRDGGATFVPGKLGVSFPNAPSALAHTLVQKADGTFQLLLWRDLSAYDGNANRDIDNAAVTVQVTLTSPASQVRWFDPATSAQAFRSASAVTSFTVDVADSVVIVDIEK